jgi:hypothetical protein
MRMKFLGSVLALAALEAARRNGELDAWRRDRALPERPIPRRNTSRSTTRLAPAHPAVYDSLQTRFPTWREPVLAMA